MAIWSGIQSAVIRNALAGTNRVIKMDGSGLSEMKTTSRSREMQFFGNGDEVFLNDGVP
jgi:hypothetical protein